MTDIIAGVFNNALGFFEFVYNIPSILNSVIVGIPSPLLIVLGSVLGVLIAYRIISILL